MNGKKLDGPLFLDMSFGEALARFAQTKPKEVEAPTGRPPKRKRSDEAGKANAVRPKSPGGSDL